MSMQFQGMGLPLDQDGMSQAIERLRITMPELWAVLTVETRGCGFLPDRRPLILFERHIFSRKTHGQFDDTHPDISQPAFGGYGAGGAAQYQRLEKAIALDRLAALQSASWGIGQVMGFNAEMAGYGGVEELVDAMTVSENHHLQALAGEIIHNRLDQALRNHDWASFARGYNGPAYAKNRYDTRLAAAYQKFVNGSLPDLAVRTAQMYLTYLGYHPGPVDGIPGRFTYSALHEFQQDRNLDETSDFDDDLLSLLRENVYG